MQAPGFVCRSCLSRLQRQYRKPLQLRPAHRLHDASTTRRAPPLTRPNDDLDSTFTGFPVTERGERTVIRRVFLNARGSNKDPSGSTLRRAAKEAAEQNDQDRGFDEVNYPVDDTQFWEKYDELWDLPTGSENGSPSRGIDGQDLALTTIKKVLRNRTKKPPKGKSWGQTLEKRNVDYARVMRNAQDKALARKRFEIWKKQFSRIWSAREAGKPPPAKKVHLELKRLLKFGTVEAMKEAWLLQPREKRDVRWIHVMIGALSCTPEMAHLVLEAIFEPEDADIAPFYAISDSLHLLVQRSKLELPGEGKDKLVNSLADLLIVILRSTPPRYLELRQNALYHILTNVKGQRLADLYNELISHKHPLHTYTLLQFARCLARDADYKPISLAIMQDLVATKSIDINSPHGAALCTTILSLSEEDAPKELTPTPAQFFEMLLELGLMPNIITYTTIIRNLCLNKQLKVAWEVFAVMEGHKIEPDIYVYSILLNGSKLCDDYDSIAKVLGLASSKGIGNPIFWNDVLHAIFLLYVHEARSRRLKRPWTLPAFQAMFRVFANIYHTEPLQTFALSDLEPLLLRPMGNETPERTEGREWRATSKALSLIDCLPVRRPEDRLEPQTDTLGLMLISYIGGFSKVYNIIAFYSRFRGLLKSGDPVAVRFVQEKGTLLHDIVIKAVVEWPGMLRVALDVVSDMLKDGIAFASTSACDASPSSAFTGATRHPAPSHFTWNILLNGFMHHQHTRQGERILTMMRENGIEPDAVTWNTLLAGYARAQKISQTVGALQKLERAGLKPDEYTMRGFSYLNNRNAAVEMMEGIMEGQRKKEELAKLRELHGDNTHEDNAGVEAALRDMEMVVDEVGHEIHGPSIHDVETESDEWDEMERAGQHGAMTQHPS